MESYISASTLPNGMFLIKFKHGDFEKVLKINVIH
jgi:hypothetical protein